MTRPSRVFFAVLFSGLVLLAACGGDSGELSGTPPDSSGAAPTSPTPSAPTTGNLGLPLLGQGAHLGAWPTYDAPPAAVAAAVGAKLAEARAAGLSIARVHVSWGQLEPSPGQFDLGQLRNQLLAATPHGLAVHVLIESLDSDGYALPRDLMDATDPYRLAGNRRLDDPVILARFDALLGALLPALAGHRVFAISIANEPDAYFDDQAPSSPQGAVFRDALVGFLTAGRTRIRAALPEVAVAMTLRQVALDKGFGAALKPVIAAGDVAVFNYYCQDAVMLVKPVTTVAADLDAIIGAAAGLPVVLQELGCPAGRSPSQIGASEAEQAAFFATAFNAMVARPALRAAFVFQALDWSPALAREFSDPLRQAGLAQLADRFEETLVSIGLIRLADGSPRPAWTELMNALARLR